MSVYEEIENYRLENYNKFKKKRNLGLLLLIVLVGIIFLIQAGIMHSKLKAKVKDKVVNALINEKFEEGFYDRKGYISESVINSTGLLKRPDRYQGEDYISGKYHGVKFEVSDVTLFEKHTRVDSNGHTQTTYESYFRGRWFIFDYERDFKQTIKIKETTLFDAINTKGLEKVEVESIDFSKKFKMYASDKTTVFYLLTPVVIEKMLELETKYRGQIMFAFINGVFHMGINNNKDYLEIKISKPINADSISVLESQINIIGAVIEEFRFDTDKFKAQPAKEE